MVIQKRLKMLFVSLAFSFLRFSIFILFDLWTLHICGGKKHESFWPHEGIEQEILVVEIIRVMTFIESDHDR